MYSLYHSLLAQHSRQLNPIRCSQTTIAQLHRCLEDVVIENDLSALVIEALPQSAERAAHEFARVSQVALAPMDFYFFVSPNDPLARLVLNAGKGHNQPVLVRRVPHAPPKERFLVIADANFSALLASVPSEDESGTLSQDHVIWTFEPDVVYSALEYLMARISAEHPLYTPAFSKAVQRSMPKATSLKLALGVTTKLARLLQAQGEREVVVNRIAAAVREVSKIDSVLQNAVNELGGTLGARSCAVSIPGKTPGQHLTKYYFCASSSGKGAPHSLLTAIENAVKDIEAAPRTIIGKGESEPAVATVPLMYKGTFVGILRTELDDPAKVLDAGELLLMQTVADQLTVAFKHATLAAEMQQQALTDALTGCHNRRSFELQLERDLHLSTRMRQPLSLIMLDLDCFKMIVESAGQEASDLALSMVAEIFRKELRAVDTAARLGGDEFAIILPQAAIEGAKIVAERLRRRINTKTIPEYGAMSASFGIAAFPMHASSRDTLVVAADQALYNAKNSGRNCVCVAIDDGLGMRNLDRPDRTSRQQALEERLT